MRLIAAIDILDGKCVRLTQGDYSRQKKYSDHPLDVARNLEDHGIQFLHLVDLDGARLHHIVNGRILEEIATHTSLTIDFGGGIRTVDDVRTAFDCGASQITGGSIAVRNPEEFLSWVTRFGPEKIILGADARNRKIAIHGWTEESEIDVVRCILDYAEKGVMYTICTDIAQDGMMNGPSTDLYEDILAHSPIRLIASGGIADISDLHRLKAIGCEGAIIGKALYEGTISLNELTRLC